VKLLRPFAAIVAATVLTRCASSPPASSPAPGAEPVTPADFVASIADVASGRNAALAETGLVLKRIEFRLLVGTETKGGGKIEILLLDADASRSSETAFTEDLTLEVPEAGGKRIAPAPLVPGVREFVDAAMNTARDLARAASTAGLPQQLHSVELTARITRSTKASGGINATIPAWVKPSVGADVSRTHEDDNTVRLVFEPRLASR
jgi:hypothetical protein